MEELVIKGSCRISEGKVFLNGALIYQEVNSTEFLDFIKGTYKFFNTGYLKFFKMDSLSKLGFLAADVLLKKFDSDHSVRRENIGIVLSNASSSLDTDYNYFDSIKDRNNYFPSPSVFVYTLPNIMIGEICIKHKITGETTFFVSERFDAELMHQYVSELFKTGNVEQCLTGWVELFAESYKAVMFYVGKRGEATDENVIFDPGTMTEFLNNI